MEVAGTQLLGSGQAKACPTLCALDLGGAFFKHGVVIVCATTACLRARLGTAPIRSRERQRADTQLLMTFCLACPFSSRVAPLGLAYALRSETRLFPRKRKNPPLLSPTLAGVGGNGRTGIVLRYGYLKLER